MDFIAILTKFCTRRAAEDSTLLYGEAAQRRTGLCEYRFTYMVATNVYVNECGYQYEQRTRG